MTRRTCRQGTLDGREHTFLLGLHGPAAEDAILRGRETLSGIVQLAVTPGSGPGDWGSSPCPGACETVPAPPGGEIPVGVLGLSPCPGAVGT